MNKESFYSLMKAVPKAELHLHGEAVISRKTVRQIFKSHFNTSLSMQELKALFSYDDLPGFLDTFIKIQSYFLTEDDFSYILNDFYDYLKANNIVYCESFLSPTSHIKNGFDFHKMISVFEGGISLAERNGRTIRMIIDVSRSFGADNAMNNLNLTLKENSPFIIGIGLGGNEKADDAAEYKKVFEKARKKGLHVVSHAGEVCGPESIRNSLKYLHSERIGHGISAVQDEKLMKCLAEKQIPLEVCPSSNVFIGTYVKNMTEHPIRELFDKGILVTLNTDDPTFFRANLIDEYWNLYSKLNFNLKEIKKIIQNGFTAAFISEAKKKAYIREVNKAWKNWFEAHPEIDEKH